MATEARVVVKLDLMEFVESLRAIAQAFSDAAEQLAETLPNDDPRVASCRCAQCVESEA